MATTRFLHTPDGVRDICNEECLQKLVLEDRLQTAMRNYGYHSIQTPTFEYFDVFSREIGTIPSRELYKFFDKEGNTLVLRPDMTPSIARLAGKMYANEDFPVRFCYTGNTFVNHASLQGKLREVTQTGAELIGDDSVDADAEMIAMTIDCMKQAGFPEFQVSVGQMDFFHALVEEAALDEDTVEELRRMISRKNQFGIEELLEEHVKDEALIAIFLKLPELYGSVEMLANVKEMTTNSRAIAALERLESIYEIMKFYGMEKYVFFDLGMLTKHRYYTGVIFRSYTYGTGEAIIKGGRYNNLLSYFGKQSPAIGFAVIVNHMMSALMHQKIEIPYEKQSILLVYDKTQLQQAVETANKLRAKGVNIAILLKSEGKTIADYKEYAKRHTMTELLFAENADKVMSVNLETDATTETSLQAVVSR